MHPLRIAIALVAIVGTIVLANVVFVWNTTCRLYDQRAEYVTASIKALHGVIDEFRRPEGRCPTQGEGLAILVSRNLLAKVPVDAWGNDYEYRSEGHTYSLTSFGADRRPGGGGDDADIRRTFSCPISN